MVKNLPASAEYVRDAGSAPGSGRSPRGGNGTHPSILPGRISWTEEPGRLQSMGLKRDTTEAAEHTGLRTKTTLPFK